MKKPDLSFWRPLNGVDEKEFAQWAAQNFEPQTQEVSETWHPVTRAACWEMMAEEFAKNNLHTNSLGCKKVFNDLKQTLSDFQTENPNEDVVIYYYLQALLAKHENQMINNQQ
jgi:hypothetical protein